MEIFSDKKKGTLQVQLLPEELLWQPFPKPKEGDGFGDVVRALAWRLLNVHAGKVIGGRKFAYGDTAVLEGKFVVTFFNARQEIFNEPGGA